jgi:hypothetical protein
MTIDEIELYDVEAIDEIELYDVEAIDEILSHLSDEDANVVQRAISSLCGMITI